MNVTVGARISTSYGSGPYIVTDVDGPCTCPEYARHINGDDTPSRPHFHLTCRREDRSDTYWLNGYTLDGHSVWSKDRVLDASQYDLFEDRQ